ncbi:hypothetical protein BDZ91DRAFT_281884 [Kalaharituber pfeilii]|nr:hypothetical protein BDZ91DRAFT_281884 [Kalaharituber pfeilii]
MARLNDSQPPGETIEALKKRYIRQNREIARANSAQSIRIRALENEASQLLEENIKLREQVIKLTVELDRRDRSHEILQNLSSTKTALEEKVKEILQLVGGLSAQVPAPPRDKLATGPKPVEERVWRNQYLASIEQEGLSPIKEDPVFPRKSSSIEDVPILPPAHRYDGPSPGSDKDDNENENENEKGGKDEDEDTYPDPPFSAYLDIRPRRRRDSTIAKSSLKSTTTTTITTTTFNLPIRSKLDSSPTKPTKRKFEDTTSPERRISFGEDEVSETFTFRVPEKSVGTVAIPTAGNEKTLKSGSDGAANEVLRRLNSETWSVLEGEEGNEKLCGGDKNASNESTGNGESKKEKVEPKREEEEESAKKEAAPAATDENKRGSKFTSIVLPDDCSALDMVPKPKKSNTSTAQRMALGPKTVNADLCPPKSRSLIQNPATFSKNSSLLMSTLKSRPSYPRSTSR